VAGDFFIQAKGPTNALGETIEIEVTYIGCTKVICLFPFTERLQVRLQKVDQVIPSPSGPSISLPMEQVPAETSLENRLAKVVSSKNTGIIMLLLVALLGGLATNLTPCVAPMIPITIRILGAQTESPMKNSILYALGIMLTYTILGVFAAMSGALFGNFIANPFVSAAFAAAMFVMAISMLGFADLTKLQTIGSRIGSGKSSSLNAFLMGTGAGLVAAPCTGPVLAMLLTYAAGEQNFGRSVALFAAYSFGFAMPYALLGRAASKVTKIRVPPHIQVGVKLAFAAVMMAVGFYYLRLPLYKYFVESKEYASAIAAACLALGLPLAMLAVGRHPNSKLYHLAPAFLIGASLFYGVEMLRAPTAQTTINWVHDEKEAFERARRENKPILVDAWAEWCEACKKMDVTTFMDPQVQEIIQTSWIALKLDLTETTHASRSIEQRYELAGLPTLTLLPPSADFSKKQAIAGYATGAELVEQLQSFGGRHGP
jgi:thiol:disulfide interchange protein DsbD